MDYKKSSCPIWEMKCPRCHTGNLFISKNAYSFSKIAAMPKNCPCCGQATDIEPGFYIGAMYVSYAICLVVFLINFLILGLFFDFSVPRLAIIYALEILLMVPLIFRYSRVIYIHIFVNYEEGAIEKFKNS